MIEHSARQWDAVAATTACHPSVASIIIVIYTSSRSALGRHHRSMTSHSLCGLCFPWPSASLFNLLALPLTPEQRQVVAPSMPRFLWPTRYLLVGRSYVYSWTFFAIQTYGLHLRDGTSKSVAHTTRSSAIAKSTARPSCLLVYLMTFIGRQSTYQQLINHFYVKPSNSAK